jgi:hypothetical protein
MIISCKIIIDTYHSYRLTKNLSADLISLARSMFQWTNDHDTILYLTTYLGGSIRHTIFYTGAIR